MTDPARRATEGEKDGEELWAETHSLVDEAGAEVYVRLELLREKVVVFQGGFLEGCCDCDKGLDSADGVVEVVGEGADDTGARVVGLLDAVAEANYLVFASLDACEEGGDAGGSADAAQHI